MTDVPKMLKPQLFVPFVICLTIAPENSIVSWPSQMDISANAVVGSRSRLSSSSASGFSKRDDIRSTVEVPMTLWSRRVKYYIAYAISAKLALLLLLKLGGCTLALLLMRRTGIDKMCLYLAQTSTGRILAHFMYPGESSMSSPAQ